ncbi:MAG: hypothetical protein QHH02_00720 [Syntrophomonadaceae bacterium]|nr:hypothetical protein [Syntrophomonadaceae bacterium]
MKTWYIEDAGGGCRAFSEVLVLVCEDPRIVLSTRIPLTWEEDLTLEQMASRLVRKMMEEAGVTKSDCLLVCSGNIFHDLHRWLTEEQYNWEFHKMDGLAHQIAEELFYQQLLEAGFPAFIRPSDNNYRLFYSFVERWVAQDDQRQKYLKDRTCRAKPAELHFTLRGNSHRRQFCHKCREEIAPYRPLVEYCFKQNGCRRRQYFHPHCSPVEPGKIKLSISVVRYRGQEWEAVRRRTGRPGMNCAVCGKELLPDEEALHWYDADNRLRHGHPECLDSVSAEKRDCN